MNLLENALSFLFPKKCIMCKKYGEIICDNCIRRIEKYERVQIIKFQNKNLNSLIYFFKYEKLIRKLMLQYKFFDKPVIAEVFAKIILKNEKLCGNLKFYDIITSVPMYKKKKLSRGYNQTELFAKKIADNLNIDYNSQVLIKNVDNKRQSSLTFKQRQDNVKNVFEVLNSENIKNKNVILIDDIYTTGATLEECAKVLKKAGAKNVLGLVIAKD
jgi:ComF family protein